MVLGNPTIPSSGEHGQGEMSAPDDHVSVSVEPVQSPAAPLVEVASQAATSAGFGDLMMTTERPTLLNSGHPNERGPALKLTPPIPGPVDHLISQDDLSIVVAIQSLLVQFSHPQVRADFHCGVFGCNVNPQILPRLDELRWTLMPRWQSGSLVPPNFRDKAAAQHWVHLIRRSELLLLTDNCDMDQCLTYKIWFSTLDSIASDRYWSRTPADSRCTHLLQSSNSESNSTSRVKQALPIAKQVGEPTASIKGKSKVPKNEPKSSSEVSFHRPQRKRDRTPHESAIKVEEIVISSSTPINDSDGNSVCEGDPLSASDEKTMVCLPRRRSQRRRRRHSSSSDSDHSSVKPPVFIMDGRQSLKDYLQTYENYFDRKYHSNTYDKTQMLSKFLDGDLLKAYQIRGGRRLKYSAMKDELLQFYSKQKIGGKAYWREQLSNALLEPDENLDLFGMRLAEFARLAYPTNKKESAKHLRIAFLKSIHPSIKEKILEVEVGLEPTSSGKTQYLTFNRIVRMAKTMKKNSQHPVQKVVMWASDPPTQALPPCDGGFAGHRPSPPREVHRSREFHARRPEKKTFSQSNEEKVQHQPVRQQRVGSRTTTSFDRNSNNNESTSATSPVRCLFCKLPGHLRRNCRRANKLCLICGKDHLIEQCPRYNPQHESRSRSRDSSVSALN